MTRPFVEDPECNLISEIGGVTHTGERLVVSISEKNGAMGFSTSGALKSCSCTFADFLNFSPSY